MGAKLFFVNSVHGREIAHALEEHSSLYDFAESQLLGTENGLDVVENLKRLAIDSITFKFSGCRRERKLTRAEQEVSLANGV